MSTHQGTTITDIIRSVHKVTPRQSSVEGFYVDDFKPVGWKILVEARLHISEHIKLLQFGQKSGDMLAWQLMEDLQDDLLAMPEASKTCTACFGSNDTGEFGYECGRPSVGDSEMCEKHLAEFGI